MNLENAASYKTTKLFTQKLKQFITFPWAFNISNSYTLIQNLKDVLIHPNTCLVSLDVNMYTSIPMQELRHITDSTLEFNKTDKTIKHELLTLHTITKQNYFPTITRYTNNIKFWQWVPHLLLYCRKYSYNSLKQSMRPN